MILGGKDAKTILKENVLYAEGGRRLDVYLPVRAEGEREELAPVIVFVGGGNWSWWRKSAGAQTALRLRRLGFAVVVPDLTQWPRGKTPEMVSRRFEGVGVGELIRSTGERSEACARVDGGEDSDLRRRSGSDSCPCRSLLLCEGALANSLPQGYGSGAHLSLVRLSSPSNGPQLTIFRSLLSCKTPSFARATRLSPRSSFPSPLSFITKLPCRPAKGPELDISAGIRRCQIWGEEARLPPIAGLILVSGVFDLIKQLRFEAKLGIEDSASFSGFFRGLWS